MRKPEQPPTLESVFLNKTSDFIKGQHDPQSVDLLRKAEAEYWHWEHLRFRVSPPLESEVIWALAKFSRRSRYKTLPLFGHNRQLLQFNTPDSLQHELMLIDQQLAGGLTSDEDSVPPESQRERYIVSALQEEAIASSMIEGAATTRQEAKQMLKKGRRPRNRGEQMVQNNYLAILFIRENRNTDLSPGMLIELQKILTQNTLDHPDQAGRFRTDEDRVVIVDGRYDEVLHVPPPASELSSRIEALCNFANQPPSERDFIHPVISACILHFQIGFDHPFCDGNGRTARALFYWMMMRRGYWLFE